MDGSDWGIIVGFIGILVTTIWGVVQTRGSEGRLHSRIDSTVQALRAENREAHNQNRRQHQGDSQGAVRSQQHDRQTRSSAGAGGCRRSGGLTLLRGAIFAVVLVAVFLGRLGAQTGGIERFQLFNECAPIDLIVEGLPDAAANIDLTEERIQTLAESRLRAARMYDPSAVGYLYVRVGVTTPGGRRNGAYTAEVSFKKRLYDSASNQSGIATTWDTGGYGTHGGDAGYILQSVSEYLDRFILEYLRANESACG